MEELSILLGKAIQKVTRLKGGGGSALPGLVVEHMDPQFIKKVLSELPMGVAVVSGTNGKTTTTKIVSELLEAQGLRVFTNRTGSNFVRGVISEIIEDISLTGKFDYDIAVLELDEAHAVRFLEACDIDYVLLLNVQRDQLDRFGEIDHTAELLQKVAENARKTCVLNREDPRISRIRTAHPVWFGLGEDLLSAFPSDDDLIVSEGPKVSELPASVTLESLNGQEGVFCIDGEAYSCRMELKGIYNAYNAAGALALCRSILPEAETDDLIHALSGIHSAFGRGESLQIGGRDVELYLVKNPSAFMLGLASFADAAHDFMIAINDEYADGRDVSWLWNVDFSRLAHVKVVTGIRASDMALRLKYEGCRVDVIEEDIGQALRKLMAEGDAPCRIFATYTAMLEIRRQISGKSIL